MAGMGESRDKSGGWACLKPRHLYEGAVCSHSGAKMQAIGWAIYATIWPSSGARAFSAFWAGSA